jgi:hypothetical protein
MADEKRQLILDLLARNKMGSETSAAARDVDKLATAADRAGNHVDDLGKTTVIAGKETEKLGHDAESTKRRINDLDDEIRKSTRELGELAVAFHEAGNQADKLDISKSMRKVENDIRRTSKAKGLLSNLLPSEDDGHKAGEKLAQSIRDGLAVGQGALIGGAAIVGAAIAPELGGIIAGAVVGGIGAGGIIGGMALAFKGNAQAQDYASRIGKEFKAGITKEARGAFDVPLAESLNKAESLAQRSVGKLGKIFDNLAPSTGKFVDSLVRSADVITDSLVNASSKAAPVMGALGRIIEGTSSSLGKFIDMAADHATEGASALDDLNGQLQSLIDTATHVVGALADIKGGLDGADAEVDSMRYSLEDHVGWLDLTADGYKKGSAAAELYRKGLIGAKGSANDYDHLLAGAVAHTDELATSQTNEARAAMGQRDAIALVSKELRAQSDPAFALLNAQDNLRQKQDELSEATGKYGAKSVQARAAARDLATAAIDLQGAAGNLSGKFNGSLTPAMMASMRAAGLTEGEIAAVAAEFGRARRAGDAYAKTYRAKVITDYINRYSNVVVSAADKAYNDTKASLKKRASGGPISRGTPYLVGENGPEVVVPSAAGRVLSAAGSRGMAKNGIAGAPVRSGGGGGQTLRLDFAPNADALVVALFRKLVRSANLLQEDPA